MSRNENKSRYKIQSKTVNQNRYEGNFFTSFSSLRSYYLSHVPSSFPCGEQAIIEPKGTEESHQYFSGQILLAILKKG